MHHLGMQVAQSEFGNLKPANGQEKAKMWSLTGLALSPDAFSQFESIPANWQPHNVAEASGVLSVFWPACVQNALQMVKLSQ